MVGSVVEERIENERFLAAFSGGRRRFGPVIRIEYAWPACLLRIGIGRRRDGRRRCGRGQVEAALAAAAREREHSRDQKDDGPSRRSRAVVAVHDKNPQCGTIQRFPCSGETLHKIAGQGQDGGWSEVLNAAPERIANGQSYEQPNPFDDGFPGG
jgi:hypothetical protein